MPITFQQSLDDIARLVKQFNISRADYLAPGFKEAQARQALIDPLFIALGWDVHNREGVAPDYQFVLVEESRPAAGHQRAPDYTFRTGKHDRKFFAEAKKPGIALKSSADSSYQLRSYGWNAKLPLSILTDFEEFAVYNCRRKPLPKDKPNVARLHYYTCEEYAERWREIWDVFSLEAVRAGAFDQFARSGQSERGASTVDADFLETIEGWRKALAQNIELRNQLHEDDLTDAVQRSIDRLVFLRIAEDREIEPYEQLAEIGRSDGIYKRLAALFRKADKKYNSGLFNFDADKRALRLEVDDRVLRAIIGDLYGAYNFRIMPVEILGNVYEQFLGKVIHVTAGGHAKVEEKPEVRKAGGVYYTPSYIVDYIVRNTVGKQVEGKAAKEVAKLRVLDMACGSGSFLLGAYQFLLDWHLHWYMEHEPQKRKAAVYDAGRGERSVDWRLTTEEKKRILLANIYGVDIDRQAVEVTKLSLLLKVLEDEKGESGQLLLLERDGERVLPDLDKNILCGNSLIGPDFFEGSLMPAAEEMKRVNPFDWRSAFPEIMRAGGFDCVIGNPPYIRIQTMKEWAPLEVEIYKEKYVAAGSGNYDIYVVFVEKALSLLNETGRMGFIVPSKFLSTDYGQSLRGLISTNQALSQIVDFGHAQVFDNASTYTCLLFLTRAPNKKMVYAKYPVPTKIISGLVVGQEIDAGDFTSQPWIFSTAMESNIVAKMMRDSVPLGNLPARIGRGSSSGADKVFMLTRHGTGFQTRQGQEIKIEAGILKIPIYATDFGRYRFNPDSGEMIIFPYDVASDGYKVMAESELRSLYPLAHRYLSDRKREINERKQSGAWYGFSAPRNLDVHHTAQILVPLLADRGLFCRLPTTSVKYCLMASGGFSITISADRGLSPDYVLGLLNSRLLFWRLKAISNVFRGGWITCTKQYVETLPIHIVNFSDLADKTRHDRMVALVERMLELHKRLHGAGSDSEREVMQRQIEATDRQIDGLVYELYGLTAEEVAVVEG